MKNAIKVLSLTLLTMILVSAITGGIELEKKSFFKDKVELSIPKGFVLMSEEMKEMKYPLENRPSIIYTADSSIAVNVTLNMTTSIADQSKIPTYKTLFIQYLKSKFPDAELKESGIKEINGRKVGYTEMISQAIDTKIYNLMFFTDVDGKLLLGTFNCIIEKEEEWTPTAKKIMNSLKVK